jgi:hypothetical protein
MPLCFPLSWLGRNPWNQRCFRPADASLPLSCARLAGITAGSTETESLTPRYCPPGVIRYFQTFNLNVLPEDRGKLCDAKISFTSCDPISRLFEIPWRSLVERNSEVPDEAMRKVAHSEAKSLTRESAC